MYKLPENFSPSTGGNFEDKQYRTKSEIQAALQWAAFNLNNSGDNPQTFVLMLELLEDSPDLLIDLVMESNQVARQKLGQERNGKSPATMLGTIDAAIKVIAHRNKMFQGESAFSSQNWNRELLKAVLTDHMSDIVELAGTNTTSKNLPHRASTILWMIDHSPTLPADKQFAFLELGASGGLILDALKTPNKYAAWMQSKGYQTQFGEYFSPARENATLGVDLVIPELDWLKALVLEDDRRAETTEFINSFSRSKVIQGDATSFPTIPEVSTYFDQHSDKTPFIYCTSMLYQLTPEQRVRTIASIKSVLQNLGGGYMMISDFGANRGYPKIESNVAWIENEQGQVLSPKIYGMNQSGTKWSVVKE